MKEAQKPIDKPEGMKHTTIFGLDRLEVNFLLLLEAKEIDVYEDYSKLIKNRFTPKDYISIIKHERSFR